MTARKTKRAVEGADFAPEVGKDVELVSVRVLPFGADLISTGEHDHTGGDYVFAKGEVFEVDKEVAESLEARGFVEIQEKRGPGRPPKEG